MERDLDSSSEKDHQMKGALEKLKKKPSMMIITMIQQPADDQKEKWTFNEW